MPEATGNPSKEETKYPAPDIAWKEQDWKLRAGNRVKGTFLGETAGRRVSFAVHIPIRVSITVTPKRLTNAS